MKIFGQNIGVADNSLFSFAFIYSEMTLLICILILLICGVFLWREKAKQLKVIQKEKEEVALKYKLLLGQLNPHFFFNGLNTIQGLFINNQVREANEMMGNFSDLIRRVFEQVDWDTHPISKEIETLKLYLEIEKQRLERDLEYKIINNSNANFEDILIPPLVLQPLTEYIIWHSIVPKKSNGKIDIIFNNHPKTSHLNIQIKDDGVGIRHHRLSTRVKTAIERLGVNSGFKIKNNPNKSGLTVSFNISIKRND